MSRVEGFVQWPLKLLRADARSRAGHDGDVVAMYSGSKLTQKGFQQVDSNSTTR
jgi:hypothetical protein